MPRIKQSFIDDLLQRLDIVDVIGTRVTLKKSGTNYTACCPFHSEKTPSFSVNRQKQFFYCFGCHAGGNAISFLEKFDNLEFVEAVEELARMAGVEIEYEEGGSGPRVNFADYHELNEAVARFYHQELFRSREALAYLRSRGISDESIERYQIGYAPPGGNFVAEKLKLTGSDAAARDMRAKLLEEGVVKESYGRIHDMFMNRVIIPIRDSRGRVIGFGGRVLDDSKPKYINSRESVVFKKGSELFNLDLVRKLKPEERAFVVITEGYMDVISLDQHGVRNAVASLGTSTTEKQLDILFKNTDRIVFCYDGDAAGRHAAWRALGLTLASLRDDKELYFCFLPQEHDPDSLVRERGADGFNECVRGALPFTAYLIRELRERHGTESAEGRVRAVGEFCDLVLQIRDAPVLVQSLIVEMARAVGWDERRVEAALEDRRQRAGSAGGSGGRGQREKGGDRIELSALRGLVARLIQNPYLASQIPERERLGALLNRYADDKAAIVLDLLEKIGEGKDVTTGILVEKYRGTMYEKIMNLLAAVELDDSLESVKVYSLLSFVKLYLREAVEAKIAWLHREAGERTLTREELALSTYLEKKIRNLG